MHKLEIRIVTKIIRELSLYLMMHSITPFTIKTDYQNNNTILTIETPLLDESLKTTMIEKINRPRELEVETYGWELLGDTDQKSELDIVSLLIDEIRVDTKKDKHIFTLIRTNQYKQ